MFVLAEALAARGDDIAKGWAGSLTMGAGQFCTNPGAVFVPVGAQGDAFVAAAKNALSEIAEQTMLTDGIAEAFRDGASRVAATASVRELAGSACSARAAAPYLFETSGADWLANAELAHEVFGPLGIVVRVTDHEQAMEIARGFEGQLTATLHLDEGDKDAAQSLMPVLERKAGRLLVNGYPTGVEVCDAMVHGGPYPASTNFGATSVGTLAIRRFVRPVCYQNAPDWLLPGDM